MKSWGYPSKGTERQRRLYNFDCDYEFCSLKKARIPEVKTLFNFYPFELIDIFVSVFHIFVFVFDNDDGGNE